MSEGLPKELDRLLSTVGRLKLGVVGDFCLDFYQFVDLASSEVSVETGLATLPVREVRYSLGGAGNVVSNLAALGAREVRCFGVVGDDPHGELLLSLLRRAGAEASNLLVHPSPWLTQTYTKVMVEGRENPRIDWGNYNTLTPEVEAELVRRIERDAADLDLLIINQQLIHGIHTSAVRRALAELAGRGSPICICDSRDYSDDFTGAIRKLNEHEGLALCGTSEGVSRGPREIAESLQKRWRGPVLLTRGGRGCIVCDGSSVIEIPGVVVGPKIDTVGAGDSMLAGTAVALAAGRSIDDAARLGNLVAAVTVGKLNQTGTASPAEVSALAESAVFRYRPELAAMPHTARFYESTRIEIATGAPRARRFTHAIFDNDGTLSTLRQGWEEVMAPMMVRCVLGSRSVDEATYRTVEERVDEYIDRTTGVQTLIQMHGLAEMVREFGFVEAGQVLTPEGYKELYNRELMLRINERLVQLEQGELESGDLMVKGASEFVRRLKELGIHVYLASGTDHDDVVREASALGYAGLFGEEIFGSVGDIENDPKKKVIEAILDRIGLQGGETILTFGDGPVEIRETRRKGGYTVGVASDELRRFGVNQSKRKRLVEAGADLIIGDFRQADHLLTLLGEGANNGEV